MLTNVTNLPNALYLFLDNHDYDRGKADISVTSLIAPPRLVALKEYYGDDIEEDVKDSARRLIGNAVHEALAKHGDGRFDDAERLFMQVNGWTVSGQTDTVRGTTVYDYKTMGVAEWKRGVRKEREQQLNCYAELLRTNGHQVDRLVAVCIFVDWNPMSAEYQKDRYPADSIVEIELPLWSREQAQEYILDRVKAHQSARHTLPECSNEDVWAVDRWSVVKDGNVRATRVFDSEEEAYQFADEKGSGYNVEYHKGEPIRCRFYCDVGRNGLCGQYNQARLNEGAP